MNDIYLEVNGVKFATVTSYRTLTVASTPEGSEFHIELSKVYFLDIDLQSLPASDFILVNPSPDGDIIYTGCRWIDILLGEWSRGSIEKVNIVAKKRTKMTREQF